MSRLIITKSIENFTCHLNDNLDTIIQKISDQSGIPLVVIGNQGSLKGVISNGDILRHVKSKSFSSSLIASDLMNKFPVFVNEDSPKETIQKILGDKVRIVPMVNNLNIVKSIGLIGLKISKLGQKI